MNTQISSGARVEYHEAGQGPPVVLLHAFPLAGAMWRLQVQEFQKSFRVIAPDLRGFGGTSGFDGAPSIERMADDVAELLHALVIAGPIVLGGLSMGGYAALAFARKYPTRLRGLILADTRAEADSPEGKANRDKVIAFALWHTAADVIDQMLPRMVSDQSRDVCPEVVAEVRRIASDQAIGGIVGALEALRDRPDATLWLGHIKVPTLVVVGSEDVLTPPAVAEVLAAGIRGADRVILAGAGHLSSMEQPGPFNAALGAFLKRLP